MTRLKNVGMIITKTAKNNVIGGTENFTWPNLKYHKARYNELIKNKFLIVGRKTFESLDVLSSDHTYLVMSDEDPNGIKNTELENVKFFWRVSHLLKYVGDHPAIVIGGASIFKRFERYISYVHLTEVDEEIEGDIISITNLSLIPVCRLDVDHITSFIDYVVKNGPMDEVEERFNFNKQLIEIDRRILF